MDALLTPELLRRLDQFLLLSQERVCDGGSASAKRINVNSRGLEPTEPGHRNIHGPEGAVRNMATYTQIYYHVVFSTKDRVPALTAEKRENLFRYVWGVLKNKDCHLYRINGVEDHVHILTSLHPAIALADLVKEIKTSTSRWVKDNAVFRDFTHWQDGYGAFTVSHCDMDAVIEYIKNQQEHHKKISFRDELRELLVRFGVQFDEKYLV